MTHSIRNKRVLLISPSFHGIHNKIVAQLAKMGANVDYYDERPPGGFFVKAALRLRFRKILSIHLNRYYKKILEETKSKEYDYIFIINIEAINEEIFKLIKEKNVKSKTILYMWDSLKLKPVSPKLLSMFSKVYTFDYQDSVEKNITFLDLFYSEEYELSSKKATFDYDLCFIGTIHGDRYELLKEIEFKASQIGLKVYFYFFMPSRVLFFLRKCFDGRVKGLRYKDVRFKSLDSVDISDKMRRSNVIIDLSYKDQCGLSMRTFEVIGVGRKLMTTNKFIKNYDFFNNKNVSLISKEDIQIDQVFIDADYRQLDAYTYDKYSLKTWLERIFFAL